MKCKVGDMVWGYDKVIQIRKRLNLPGRTCDYPNLEKVFNFVLKTKVTNSALLNAIFGE